MTIKKPNWSATEIIQNLDRRAELLDLTELHPDQCDCNLCWEYFRLDQFLETFSEEDVVGAVNETNMLQTPLPIREVSLEERNAIYEATGGGEAYCEAIRRAEGW